MNHNSYRPRPDAGAAVPSRVTHEEVLLMADRGSERRGIAADASEEVREGMLEQQTVWTSAERERQERELKCCLSKHDCETSMRLRALGIHS